MGTSNVVLILVIIICFLVGYVVFRLGKGKKPSYLHEFVLPIISSVISGLLLFCVTSWSTADSEPDHSGEVRLIGIERSYFRFVEEDGKWVYNYPFTPLNNGSYTFTIGDCTDLDIISVAIFDEEGNSINFSASRVDSQYIIEVNNLVADHEYLFKFINN